MNSLAHGISRIPPPSASSNAAPRGPGITPPVLPPVSKIPRFKPVSTAPHPEACDLVYSTLSMDSLEKLKQQAQAFRDDAVAVPSALRGRRLDGIPDPLDRRGGDWLRANGLAPAVTPEELRARHARGEEADVAAAAEAAAWAACDLVLRAQPVGASELFDESILTHARAANDARRAAAASARNQLGLQGVCGEHLALPPKASIPLVHEMVFARHVGSSAAARRREPPAASFGKEHQWPTMPTASAPPPPDATLAVVVVAYHGDATGRGLEWLQELPPRVTAQRRHGTTV